MEFQYLSESSSRTNRQDNHSTSNNSTNNTFQQPIQLTHHQNNLYQYQFDISHFNQTSSVDSSTSATSTHSLASTATTSSSFVQQQQQASTNNLQNNISSLSSYQYNFPINSNTSNYSTQNIPSKVNHHLNYQQNQQQHQQQNQQHNSHHQPQNQQHNSHHQQQNQQHNSHQQQQNQQHNPHQQIPQHYQNQHQNQLQQQQYQHHQEEQAGSNFITSSNSISRHNTFTNQLTMNKSRQSRETGIQNTNERPQQQQQQPPLVTNCTPQVPQYRIFKRGDTIPGIPTPQISLPSSSSMNMQNNESHDGTNSTTNNVSQHHQQQMHQAQQQQQVLQQQQQVIQQQHLQQQLQQTPRDLNCENVSTHVNNLNNINNLQSSIDIQSNDGMSTNNTSTAQPPTATLINSNAVESNTDSSDPQTTNSEQNKQINNEKGGSNHRTPISIIGDIARFHGVTPEYRLTNETGPPHCPIFTIVLSLGNEQYQAQGNSIKKAQLAAAQIAVEKTKLSRPPARTQTKRNHSSDPKRTNWTIMQLNSLAEELNEKLSFTSQPVPIMNPYGRNDPPSIVNINIGERVFSGEGRNFNEAKNQAAMGALKALLLMKQEREVAKLKENGLSLQDAEIDTEGKSPISVCHEMALKRGLSISFEVKGEEGPPHLKKFTVECYVGDLTTVGTGSTKQNAKKATCEMMIEKLKEVPPKLPKITTSISIKAMQKGFSLKPKVSRKKPTTPVVKEVDKQVVSPISRLLQIAHVKKFREPEFSLVVKPPTEEQNDQQPVGKKGGHRHSRKKKPLFTMEVKIGPHICTGTGPNKKAAKKAAANAALVLLGYAPTETKEVSSNGNATGNNATHNKTNGSLSNSPQSSTTNTTTTEVNESTNNNKNSSEVKAYRQLVPGVIVIKGQNNSASAPTTTNMAQEMIKVNSMSPTATSKSLDGIGKLSYLAELLHVSVSYSDFPKKTEFLSVISLGTNPPHVAHGTGQTREEAQNAAALEILEELANTGLENVTAT